MCDLLDLLQEMNVQLAGHTHLPGPTPSPTDAAVFRSQAAKTALISSALWAIIMRKVQNRLYELVVVLCLDCVLILRYNL